MSAPRPQTPNVIESSGNVGTYLANSSREVGMNPITISKKPFSIHKEIEEDQNTALGLVIGAMVLGIAIIVASAIGG